MFKHFFEKFTGNDEENEVNIYKDPETGTATVFTENRDLERDSINALTNPLYDNYSNKNNENYIKPENEHTIKARNKKNEKEIFGEIITSKDRGTFRGKQKPTTASKLERSSRVELRDGSHNEKGEKSMDDIYEAVSSNDKGDWHDYSKDPFEENTFFDKYRDEDERVA